MNIENVEDVLLAEDLLPMLKIEADSKNLKVFVFDNDELKKYFTPKSDTLGVALLAKDKDNALYNFKNLRKCYLIRFK